MLTGIIICALIVGFALYDYFSTRSWQVVTSDERNDSVFENRNKSYGAYQIRRDYNKRMILILLGLTVGVGGLYGASLGISHPMKKKPKHGFTVGTLDPLDDKEDDKPVEPKKVETSAPAPQMETYVFIQPKIVDLIVKDTMEIVDPGKQVGVVKIIGTDPFGPPVDPPISSVVPVKNDSLDINGVTNKITEIAYFKGGREALIKYLTDAIDPNLEGEGTCKLKFIVGSDGAITKVWVKQHVIDCPECDKEAEKAVKNMPKWEPGKSNGTPVNSYFYLPISFR